MSQTPITVTYYGSCSTWGNPKTALPPLEEVLGEIKQSIKEVSQKLDSIQKDVNQRFDTIQKDVNDLKVEVKELSTEVKGINKRLDSQEFINRSIAVGILLTIGTGVPDAGFAIPHFRGRGAIKLFFPGFPNLPH